MNAFIGCQDLKLSTSALSLRTAGRHEFVDLTDEVARRVEESGVQHGQVLVFCRHTTAGIFVNENEPLLLQDLRRYLDRLASPDDDYTHDDLTIRTHNLVENEPANGHSHCQHLMMGCSTTLPVFDGVVGIGRWQRVFVVELDDSRDREIIFQVWGV